LWPDWHNVLILVKPETVVGWHRKGFFVMPTATLRVLYVFLVLAHERGLVDASRHYL